MLKGIFLVRTKLPKNVEPDNHSRLFVHFQPILTYATTVTAQPLGDDGMAHAFVWSGCPPWGPLKDSLDSSGCALFCKVILNDISGN